MIDRARLILTRLLMFGAAFCLMAMCARAESLYELGWSRRPVDLQNSRSIGQAITMDGFGDLYVVGNTGLRQSLLLKYDQAGNQLWAREYGSTGSVGAASVATDVAGNVFVGSQNNDEASLSKWDPAGNLLWEKGYSAPNTLSEVFDGLAVDGTGAAYALTNTAAGLEFRKYGPDGDELWTRTIERSSIGSVAIDSKGDLFVSCAYIPPSGSLRDSMVLKFDSAGNELWRTTFGTNQTDLASDIAIDPSGNIYVAGSTLGSLGGPNAGQLDAYLVRLDAGGNVAWARQAGGTGADGFSAIAFDELARIVVTGTGFNNIFQSGLGQRDALLAVYHTDGSLVWGTQLGSDRTDSSYDIVRGANGALYITDDLKSQQNYLGTSAWVQQLVPVPEPASIVMGLMGAAALGAVVIRGRPLRGPRQVRGD